MTCWVVIPVKHPEEAKQRLSPALTPAERVALVRAMLERVVEAARASRAVARTCLLGPSRHGLDPALPLIADPGGGLNAALCAALAELAGAGITRLVVLPADLPLLTARDVDLLAAAPDGSIAIAPDRHGTGTNALSLPLPAADDFRFTFGTDSFARHSLEAERLGLAVETIHSPGLARDVDEPPDLADAADTMSKLAVLRRS